MGGDKCRFLAECNYFVSDNWDRFQLCSGGSNTQRKEKKELASVTSPIILNLSSKI